MKNWDKLYENYVNKYIKKREKSPVSMTPILTKAEFMGTYVSVENERKAQVKAGKRAAVTNITRDIVSEQQEYAYSVKEARAIRNAYKHLDLADDISYKRIRTGEINLDEFWDMVRANQQYYKDLGYSSKRVNEIIAQEIFGS